MTARRCRRARPRAAWPSLRTKASSLPLPRLTLPRRPWLPHRPRVRPTRRTRRRLTALRLTRQARLRLTRLGLAQLRLTWQARLRLTRLGLTLRWPTGMRLTLRAPLFARRARTRLLLALRTKLLTQPAWLPLALLRLALLRVGMPAGLLRACLGRQRLVLRRLS